MSDYLASHHRARRRARLFTVLLWTNLLLYASNIATAVLLLPMGRRVAVVVVGCMVLLNLVVAELARRQREYLRFCMLWSWMQHEMALQDVTDEGELLVDQIPGTTMLVGRRVHTLRVDVPFFRPAGL